MRILPGSTLLSKYAHFWPRKKKKKEKISWRYQIAKLELVNKPMGDVALGLHLFSPNSPLFLAMLAEGPLGW